MKDQGFFCCGPRLQSAPVFLATYVQVGRAWGNRGNARSRQVSLLLLASGTQ